MIYSLELANLQSLKEEGRGTAQNQKGVPVEAYCVKCKAKVEIQDPREETLKNGRRAMKGKCPTCSTNLCRILGNK